MSRNQKGIELLTKKSSNKILEKLLDTKSSFLTKGKYLNVGSLFAGIGGIDLAFQNAGFNILWANEIDRKACDTYKTNFKHTIICEDIYQVNTQSLDSPDLLVAGFPCQAFSVAGYRKGFEDERGAIFFELLRFINDFKPSVIFLENVKNLQNHDNGKTFKKIMSSLQDLGYFIKYQVLNTQEYSNIPQNRERIYIVGFLDNKHFESFEFPRKLSNKYPIQDFLEKNVDKKYYYSLSHPYYETLKEHVTSYDTCYQWRRKYVRENKQNSCPTLTANMGTGGHNVPIVLDKEGIRKLTPRECANFQGFPSNYIFPKDMGNTSLYKQIGNSVSVPIVELIARELMRVLGSQNV